MIISRCKIISKDDKKIFIDYANNIATEQICYLHEGQIYQLIRERNIFI